MTDHATRDGRDWTPNFLVAIDDGTCIGCGRCYKVCGRDVMTLKGVDEDGRIWDEDADYDDDFDEDDVVKHVMVMNDPGACIGCGACDRVCPTSCQTHQPESALVGA